MKWVILSGLLLLAGIGCQATGRGGGGSGGAAADADTMDTGEGAADGSQSNGGANSDDGRGDPDRDSGATGDNLDPDQPAESNPDWPQQARLTAFDLDTEDHYANAVAASEEVIAIGAAEKAALSGVVDVFLLFGGEWLFHDRLLGGPARSENQGFGRSVAATTQLVFVGAPQYAIANSLQIQRGAVYAFRNIGPGFELEQVIIVPDGEDYEYFGTAMDTISDQGGLIVGAPGWRGSQGAAYVVGGSGPTFETKVRLTASDGGPNDKFGQAVVGGGQRIVVGAPNQGRGTGAAYIYEKGFNGDADWSELLKLTAPDGAISDQFGLAVASDSGVIAVGAPYKMRPQDEVLAAGAVYVFEQESDGGWALVQTIVPADEFAGLFGSAVGLAGGTLAIGGVGKGRVLLYEKVGGEWTMTGTIAPTTPNGLQGFDSFGESISFVRDLLVVGARTSLVQTDTVTGTGAAYIFGPVQGMELPPGRF